MNETEIENLLKIIKQLKIENSKLKKEQLKLKVKLQVIENCVSILKSDPEI